MPSRPHTPPFNTETVPFGPVAVPLSHAAQLLPEVLHVPLRFDHQYIYVRATVNGHEGWFLLDTGAPTLMLNETRLPLGPAFDSTWLGGMAGDSGIVHIYHNVVPAWGGIIRREVGAVGIGGGDLGAIGLGQLVPFTAVFDYPDRQLVLYRNNAAGIPPACVRRRRVPVRRFKRSTATEVFHSGLAGPFFNAREGASIALPGAEEFAR